MDFRFQMAGSGQGGPAVPTHPHPVCALLYLHQPSRQEKNTRRTCRHSAMGPANTGTVTGKILDGPGPRWICSGKKAAVARRAAEPGMRKGDTLRMTPEDLNPIGDVLRQDGSCGSPGTLAGRDRTKHQRRSIRWVGYDYAQEGVYFVTVCVQGHVCLFGDIVNGQMRRNELGRIVQATWYDLPNHYPHIALDAFVVMPNHVHMIVVLTPPVGAGFKPALMNPMRAESAHARSVRTGPIRAGFKPAPTGKRHGLPEIVRAFKTFSARRVNARRAGCGRSLWQRNYYEHVIRDEGQLGRIRRYIEDNPLNWMLDRENPEAKCYGQREAERWCS
ncbi:MAG: transposase [Sedimentisphaerales bacterium]|nr:transposase [Sedimentisphaerales bacterium]